MAGTVVTDLKAIALTANAKSVVSAKGADCAALVQQALNQAADLTKTVKQILLHHPTGGGDAANVTLLNNIVGELA